MSLRGKKLGILISCRPEQPNFTHGVKLAEAAINEGADVYLYCIDEAVKGVETPAMQDLKSRGLKLYGCAYGAHRHHYFATFFAAEIFLSDFINATV